MASFQLALYHATQFRLFPLSATLSLTKNISKTILKQLPAAHLEVEATAPAAAPSLNVSISALSK